MIREEKDRIFSYAYYLIKNREDAEDIVQEVLVKLWQHWNEIDPVKRMGWIMRVTHNTCIDWTRRKRSMNSRRKMVSSVNPDLLPADRAAAPDEAVILSEQHQSLLEAMAVRALPIVSNIEANREWVEDGKNGILVDLENLDGAVDKVREYERKGDVYLQNALDRNSEIVKERGSLTRNMRILEKEIDSLVQRSREIS